MQRNEIRNAQEFIQWQARYAEFLDELLRYRLRVVKDNSHAKTCSSPCDCLSDPAKTNEAQRFPIDVVPQKHPGSPCFEFFRTGELVGFSDAARGSHQKR